ncbi:MAG: peptidoglycan-binding protein [Patescibacteria group bacterium]|nr:peptidoglycan-binding protein [Patescibacteria group bacterium]
MKNYLKIFIVNVIALTVLLFAHYTYAMTPTLSLSNTGNTNTIYITVNGDPNSTITLYYNLSYGMQNRFIGSTNYNGYYSGTLNTGDYGITTGTSVYVIVNGQQSASVLWPYYSYNNLSLSQSNLSLYVGQTSTITVYNTTVGSLYVSTNSNPNVVTPSINGNVITFYANSTGSSSITICQSGSMNYCGTVYVTVSGSNYYYSYNNQNLNLSTLIIPIGSSATISTSNNQGLYVSTNSNPNIASVQISNLVPGCTLTSLYSVTTGQPCSMYTSNNTSALISANSAGSTSISLCQTNTNNCNTIYITVTGYSPVYTQNINTQYSYNNTNQKPSCRFSTNLYLGMTGDDVYCLQSYLYNLGYLSSSNLNAYFDYQTRSAVITFQQNYGLSPDGVVGYYTRYKIFN